MEIICIFIVATLIAEVLFKKSLLLLLLLLLGPRHIQPSAYTNVATYPLGKYKQCHRKHSEQCACTCGNDTYAYVHRQGSLTGIRKPQY